MKEKKFFRDCPSCGKQVGHVSAAGRKASLKCNCWSCSNSKRRATDATKAKLSALRKGVPRSKETKAKMAAYKQKVANAYTEIYGDKFKFKNHYFTKWGREVRKRDNNTCQKCATKKTTPNSIQAHHIVPCGYFMARALDIDNGVTLCSSCHRKVHCELDKYTVKGVKLSATDFINHYHEWKPNGPIKE